MRRDVLNDSAVFVDWWTVLRTTDITRTFVKLRDAELRAIQFSPRIPFLIARAH